MIGEKELVRAQFGTHAAEYAKDCFVEDVTLEIILKFTDPQPEDEALDVATGAGFTAAAIATRVKEVIALDITEEMIEQAQELFRERDLKNVITDVADAEELPYSDEVFDIVTCRIAAHHFPSVRKALKEMVRVLKPGGRLAIADSSSPEEKEIDEFLNELERIRDPGHVRNHSEEEWRALLGDCGVVVERVETGKFKSDFDEWTHRAGVSDKTKKHLKRMLLGTAESVRKAMEIQEEDGKLGFAHFWIVIGASKPL